MAGNNNLKKFQKILGNCGAIVAHESAFASKNIPLLDGRAFMTVQHQYYLLSCCITVDVAPLESKQTTSDQIELEPPSFRFEPQKKQKSNLHY